MNPPFAAMTSKPLNTARSGKTSLKNSAPNSRQIDFSPYSSPGLNFDQAIPSIGLKVSYTDLRSELTTVSVVV